jgi:hypothetical protein
VTRDANANRWSEVYDFTPNPNASKNFSLLDPAQELSFPVKPLTAVGEWSWCTPAAEKQLARAVVPVSLGQRPLPQGCDAPAIILAAGGAKDLCLELIQAVASQQAVLVQACATKVDKARSQQLHAAVGPSASHVTRSDGDVVVAAQLCGGSGLAHALKAAAERYGGEGGGIVIADSAAAAAVGNLFFAQWREHSGHAVTK